MLTQSVAEGDGGGHGGVAVEGVVFVKGVDMALADAGLAGVGVGRAVIMGQEKSKRRVFRYPLNRSFG
jgi:hypothetical protein